METIILLSALVAAYLLGVCTYFIIEAFNKLYTHISNKIKLKKEQERKEYEEYVKAIQELAHEIAEKERIANEPYIAYLKARDIPPMFGAYYHPLQIGWAREEILKENTKPDGGNE